MNNLFNLRKKHNLEIEDLAESLNEKYGSKYETHEIWEWENHYHDPKLKDALVLADYFNVSYVEFIPSEMEKLKKTVSDVDIRK
ncbi:helix-turn-helix transcriptional regulator [Staphylococcus xylosus]|uniref:helix-turn-helix domain-containing protein n=1 Tax=Staphylococcus xylosus TaxID=1288 RepID=UPI003364DF31